MPNIFVSYSRDSHEIAATLANDLRELGHVVWFDRELSGGQSWWNEILGTVRRCDVFVFVLTPQALSSTACTREYGYAAALRKPILPVLVSDGVSTNLLPPALSQIHFVDYRTHDRAAGFRLARALASLPPPGPLPDPLPAAPEVPTSYLGGLNEQIEGASILTHEQQSGLLVDLRRGLRDPETAEDSRALLKRLRRRRDLLATIAEEIDELLQKDRGATAPAAVGATLTDRLPRGELHEKTAESKRPTEQEPRSPQVAPAPPVPIREGMTRRERLMGAIGGAVLGAVVPVIALSTASSNDAFFVVVVGAIAGAIAGTLSGKRRRRIVAALVGAAVGWLGVSWWYAATYGGGPAILIGAVFGATSGAILGVIASIFFWRSQRHAETAS